MSSIELIQDIKIGGESWMFAPTDKKHDDDDEKLNYRKAHARERILEV